MRLRKDWFRYACFGYSIIYVFMCACVINVSKRLPERTEIIEEISECETSTMAYSDPLANNVANAEFPARQFIEMEDPSTIYFDIPLSHNVQSYIFDLCAEYGIDAALIIAIIERESKYNEMAIGDNGNSLGLMQIQPRWNEKRMRELSCQNLLDPYQNILVGIDILSEYLEQGKSIEWALMAYNGGPAYANRKTAKGEISQYVSEILKHKEDLYYD